MTRVLVVYAHPLEGSLTAAARDRAVEALRARGHLVEVIDLWAEGFDPVLSAEEHASWGSGAPLEGVVAEHARRLRWAEALVFVYPTWWSAQPAILKGWFDRVWRAGVAFSLPPGTSRIRPLLGNVRRIVVCTTHGSGKWINALEGEAGKRTMTRSLRAVCHPLTRVRWVAMYDVDRADDAARQRYLDRVEEAMAAL